ncbi:MAG: hypothetical protein HYT98_00990 [Candidatus Sungbacteria bacterium]|nr:hypothetical protein [Candidatus Sungbacteria bacterium]
MSIGDLEIWFLEQTFERFSHWWQRMFIRQDNFFLARTSTLLAVLSHGWLAAYPWIITIFLIIGFLCCIEATERKTRKNQEKKCANPDKFAGGVLRYLFLGIGFMLISMAVAASSYLFVIGYTTASLFYISIVYFSHCDPLPPGELRVPKFVPFTVPSRYR